jgi:DNA modification methylase
MTTETPAQDARWRNRIVGQADVPPAELRANPANWRAHPRRQREALRGSLDELGWVQQVLVNRTTGNIVDGHARLEEALRANAPTVPVLYVELTPEEEALALATIDPIAGMAVTDQAKLAELVAGITIDDDALRSLLAGLTGTTKDGLTDPDEIPDPSPSTRLQTGEMWALGNHRLFIGSSLEETSYKRLLGSRKAGLVHTDPPYGVAYMSSSGKHEAIENDELTGDKLVDFLAVAFTRMARHTEPSAAWYIWHATANRDEFAWAMKRAGVAERQYLMWVKPSPTLGHGDYQQSYEPCFYAARDGFEPTFMAGRDQQTVWHAATRTSAGKGATIGNGILITDGDGRQLWIQAAGPKGRKLRTVRLEAGDELELADPGAESDAWFVGRDHRPEHPTQKPVELAARAIRNSSRPGDIILDPFAGSGSTLIAAEQLERAAYLIELEPRYAQITIDRWQAFTGQEARRVQD